MLSHQKYYEYDCLQSFLLLVISLLTALIVISLLTALIVISSLTALIVISLLTALIVISLLTALIVKNSNILAGIYFQKNWGELEVLRSYWY